MKLVIQRVKHASVTVDGNVTGKIGKGFLVLIGIANSDTKEIADQYLKKLLNLRIFEDENGKTNLSLKDVNGELLLVSQFTLYADCRKGNRPSFINAGAPDMAESLYEYMIEACRKEIPVVETGIFGADMQVGRLPLCWMRDCFRKDKISYIIFLSDAPGKPLFAFDSHSWQHSASGWYLRSYGQEYLPPDRCLVFPRKDSYQRCCAAYEA